MKFKKKNGNIIMGQQHSDYDKSKGTNKKEGVVNVNEIYSYYFMNLFPALLSSLPLLFQRVVADTKYFLAKIIPFGLLSEKQDFLMSKLDMDGDGHIDTSEFLRLRELPMEHFLEFAESFEKSVIHKANNIMKWQQAWPMLDWKIGVFLWRTCGSLLFVILIASIVPGKLHRLSGNLLRWPVLALTYFLIWVELMVYISLRLFIKFVESVFAVPRHRCLRRRMDQAKTYDEWLEVAKAIDISQGRDKWQKTALDASVCRNYNWPFIRELVRDLKIAKDTDDMVLALAILQQCTRKNVGGVMSEEMFSYLNTGDTKDAVKTFINEVVDTIYWVTDEVSKPFDNVANVDKSAFLEISDKETKVVEQNFIDWAAGTLFGAADSILGINQNSRKDKNQVEEDGIQGTTISDPIEAVDALDLSVSSTAEDTHQTDLSLETRSLHLHKETVRTFLKRSRAVYGRTALCLSGGAMMGNYHLGAIKALFDEGVLPHIISGTSAGSVVGALVCTRNDEELRRDLNPEVLYPRMKCFSRPWIDRIKSFIKNGYLFDRDEWLEMIKWFTCGDMTFQEAYEKTGRVLCITLSATTKKAPPVLMNYITAPNVCIASSIIASAALPGLIPPVLLQYKDTNGVVRNQAANKDQTYWDGSIEQDIPVAGLAETFNCQFFVASQCNPHIVPFFFNNRGSVGKPNRWSSGAAPEAVAWRGGFLLSALELYLKQDMRSKMVFLKELDAAVSFTGTLYTQVFEGTTTIVPHVCLTDYLHCFRNPTLEDEIRYFQGGAVAAFQKIAMLKLHYSVAHVLDECLTMLEERDNEAVNNACTSNDALSSIRSSSLSGGRRGESERTAKAVYINTSPYLRQSILRQAMMKQERKYYNIQLKPGTREEDEVGGFDGIDCAYTPLRRSRIDSASELFARK